MENFISTSTWRTENRVLVSGRDISIYLFDAVEQVRRKTVNMKKIGAEPQIKNKICVYQII